jgi:hypothetical protein
VRTNIVNSSRFIPTGNESATKQDLVETFSRLARKSPEQAATIILDGVLKNKARILVGSDAKIASWIERIAPAAYLRLLRLLIRD